MLLQKTIRLHRVQKAFRQSPALYRAFVGGRGAGKTWIGSYDMIRRAKKGRLYLVASPSYTILQDTTFRTFQEIGRELGVISPDSIRHSPPGIRLTTGAEIIFRSADDPERLRGPNLSGAWLDEASLMDQRAYDIVLAALREKGEQGWLSATFTPKGLTHWTHEYFGTSRPDTEIFHATTWQNPFNPDGFADRIANQYVARQARQELHGEFVDAAGAEWPGSYFSNSIWFDEWPAANVLKVLALDPSKGQRDAIADPKKEELGDYSALVQLMVTADQNLWVDADMDQLRDATGIVRDGLSLIQSFKPDGFAVETNGFQQLFCQEFLRQAKEMGIFHLPIYELVNVVPKLERIRRLGTYLHQGKLHFKRGSRGAKLLVDQIRDFPVAKHDDGPDALEMAIRLAIELWNGTAT